jgi:hypothetical protein
MRKSVPDVRHRGAHHAGGALIAGQVADDPRFAGLPAEELLNTAKSSSSPQRTGT